MTLEVEFWTLVSVSVTFLGAITGIVWGLIKNLINQAMARLDERDSGLTRRLEEVGQKAMENAAQLARLERELLTLKADQPINYVRREDYVTAIASILTKLDSISLRFENILLKGGNRNE